MLVFDLFVALLELFSSIFLLLNLDDLLLVEFFLHDTLPFNFIDLLLDLLMFSNPLVLLFVRFLNLLSFMICKFDDCRLANDLFNLFLLFNGGFIGESLFTKKPSTLLDDVSFDAK